MHNFNNQGSRETIPQPHVYSFVSQPIITNSSNRLPKYAHNSSNAGSRISGQGSLLNNFITEGGEEDEANGASPIE